MPFIFTVAHYNLPIISFPCPHIRCHGLVPCTRRPTCYDKKHIGNHREDISHSECLVFLGVWVTRFLQAGEFTRHGIAGLSQCLFQTPIVTEHCISVCIQVMVSSDQTWSTPYMLYTHLKSYGSTPRASTSSASTINSNKNPLSDIPDSMHVL